MELSEIHEPHHPQKKHAVAFLIVALLLGAGIFLWTFFLNKGSVEFVGAAPFSVSLAGETLVCEKSPCRMRLQTGAFSFTARKEGFEDFSGNAAIMRGDTMQSILEFRVIPKLANRGTLVLPFAGAPLTEGYLGRESLPDLPSSATVIGTDTERVRILLRNGENYSLYEMKNDAIPIVQKVPYAAKTPVTLSSSFIFALSNETNGSQKLVRWNGEKEEIVVTFRRPFNEPVIAANPEGTFVVIEEKADEGYHLYIIDVQAKTRKRLPIAALKEQAKIRMMGSVVAIQNAADMDLYSLSDFTAWRLPSALTEHIAELTPIGIFFLAGTDQSSGSNSLSINDLIDDLSEEVSEQTAGADGSFITLFEPKSGEFTTVIEIPFPSEQISGFTFSEASNEIRFAWGETLYAIELGQGS